MQPKEPVMRPGSLRRQLTMLFVFLIAAQLVVVALLYSRIKHFAKQHTELLQIDELRTELYALRAAALDAETGQRGFVITGREEFLQPYRASVPSFQPRLARLHLLVAPPQKTRVEALATQLALAQSDMARLVELRRLDGFEAAQQKMLDGTQREAMDLLRAMTLEIDEEEQRQAQAQQHSYQLARSALVSLVFFGLCGGLLITLGLGLFVLARLRTLTMAMGRPLAAISRDLRATAKAAASESTNLSEYAKADIDSKAEGQATLDVITRMAKDLSTVAMEITSSVRAVADGPAAGPPEVYTEQLDRVVTLAGRVAQSALSLELTTAEQRRVFDGSSSSLLQLDRSVKSVEQQASRVKKISKELVHLLQTFPGLLGESAPATARPDGSDFEIAPIRT